MAFSYSSVRPPTVDGLRGDSAGLRDIPGEDLWLVLVHRRPYPFGQFERVEWNAIDLLAVGHGRIVLVAPWPKAMLDFARQAML